MVYKKYIYLLGLCSVMIASPAIAQESQSQNKSGGQWSNRDMTYRGENYDALDTNYISKNRMAQQKKFLNHQYAFPAQPRNMWEVGFGIGNYSVIGPVPSLSIFSGGAGFDLQVRKSWGYIFSTRFQYTYGIAKGLDYRTSTPNVTNFPTWTGNGYAPGNPNASDIVRNYRMESHQFNLDLMLNAGNINFHHAKNKVSFFGYLGLGAIVYNTRMNQLDANGTPYNFDQILGGASQNINNKGNNQKTLKSAMDKTYETKAPNRGSSLNTFPGTHSTIDPLISVGAGAQFRLSQRVNLQIEDRVAIPSGDNYLTGNFYAETTPLPGIPNNNTNLVNYLSVGVNFNLGNKKKNVEPLYWINPLDFSYNELGAPRHMLLPDPILPDADGDGIADPFDKCPGTPAGVAVDSHGCPMDTDGDGVPDFRDKQLITPTECQPVDADGVGKCPCPDGCGTAAVDKTVACGTIVAGSIIFSENSARITSAMQTQLSTLTAQMLANPTCHVVITGAGNTNKLQQQRSWDRVHSIIQYMSEKNGISRDRFIFQYGQAGDPNTVMYRSAVVGETGGDNPPPPFPNMREKEKEGKKK